MNADNKKQKQDKKIVPFEIHDEIFTDRDIDQLVKESLMQEADKLEAELNADPKLTGVGASDDMLQSIKDKLKAQGIWEEELDEIGDRTEQDGTGKDGAGKDRVGKDRVEKDRTEQDAAEQDGVPGSGIRKTDAEFETAMQVIDSDRYGVEGKAQDTSSIQNIEDLYAMLPEEDRRALELGRKMEQKQYRKEIRHRRRMQILRYSGTAVAVFWIVFGISMTSEANRRLVQKAWDVMVANFNFHVQTDYLGDEEQVRSKSREEVAAMEEISERLGISALSLEVLPNGMEYYNYEIMADNMEAVMFYTYQENIFSVTFINVNEEGSSYYVMDEKAELIENLTTVQDYMVKIWETNREFEEENRAYIAEIDREGCRYILNGILPLEEIKIIIEFAIII